MDLKLSGCDPWGLPGSFMSSGMTLSTMSLVRNPQRPPSTTLLDPLPIEIWTRNFQGIFLGVKKHHLWCQEWPSPPCLWSGTPNVLQVIPFLTPPLPNTLPIKISTRNFQGIFLGVKKHHLWCQECSCYPCLWSGTPQVLQVSPSWPPFLTHF